MSSDSDDEDELLQMALREQAERDLNYRRPPSAKPVVSHVQPPRRSSNPAPVPSAGAAAAAAGTAKKPAGRRSADEDEEVELLSISSGDEESSTDRRVAAGAGRGRAGARRGGRDDASDRGWDGEEPDCWKRVDESELGRRVREMRETKAVPVSQQTFERKGSAVGRKGLTNMQSLTRGIESIDPLGFGIIDSRTLTLIRDASENSPAAPKDKPEAIDSSTREKLNFYSENFGPKLFLARVHNDTSAADLESGALALKADLKGRTQQRKQLVKENFDCFISCKTTIDDIESKLKRIEEDPEGAGTTQLFKSIENVTSVATRALEPLFERQAQVEKIRSVQGMLQRFRTLFNLPSAIRGSISKGEYDLAVREYRKAKSIALPSHVHKSVFCLLEIKFYVLYFVDARNSFAQCQYDWPHMHNVLYLL